MGKYTKNTSFQHPLVVVEGGCTGSTSNGQDTQNCLVDSRGLLAHETKRQSR